LTESRAIEHLFVAAKIELSYAVTQAEQTLWSVEPIKGEFNQCKAVGILRFSQGSL
jgi:hypothetical protein